MVLIKENASFKKDVNIFEMLFIWLLFRAKYTILIVVTRTGFEWGSLRDVLDWTFMGYFMEDLVTELL